MPIILDGTLGITTPALTVTGATVNTGGISTAGNLTFTSTGQRIIGDMSNATIANRLAFQTSTTNSFTILAAFPNGTGTASYLDLYNTSDTTNYGRLRLTIGTTDSRIDSNIGGTGTYLPMTFYTGGSESMRIDTSGYVLIGATSASGTNKLQVTGDASISGLTVGKGGGAVSTNTAVGVSIFQGSATGTSNSAFGYNSLFSISTGSSNTGVGRAVLGSNTTGGFNTAVGQDALGLNSTASYNTAVGYQAGYNNTTGQVNTSTGAFALASTTTGGDNAAFGYSALRTNTTGNFNVSVGREALYSNSTANSNTAIGTSALYANTTASNNTAVGYQAAYSNTVGTRLAALGTGALYTNTASYNTAIGYQSGRLNTTGFITAIGDSTLYSNTTGSSNVAIGGYNGVTLPALYSNTTGSFNTAIGYSALQANTTASNNTAVGYQAGYTNQTGASNTFIGYQAGYTSNAASTAYNTAVGTFAGYSLTTGINNTFIGATNTGFGAGYYVTTGSKNTIIGGFNGNQGGLDIRTASNYIVLSDGDGNPRQVITDTGSVNFSSSNFSGQLGTSTTYGYWSNSNSSSFMQFNGASNGTPYVVYVRAGSGGVQLNSGATGWSATSDARLKNVTGTYTNALSDIAQIEPVKFTWKDDAENKPQVGVLAQSVLPVVPEAVDSQTLVRSEDETEYLTVRYTELIPLMIASIQELKAEVDSLKQQLGK